jgi:hypothetical protein
VVHVPASIFAVLQEHSVKSCDAREIRSERGLPMPGYVCMPLTGPGCETAAAMTGAADLHLPSRCSCVLMGLAKVSTHVADDQGEYPSLPLSSCPFPKASRATDSPQPIASARSICSSSTYIHAGIPYRNMCACQPQDNGEVHVTTSTNMSYATWGTGGLGRSAWCQSCILLGK